MKAIIPVAGVGTRLRPHTHTTPKVLIKVAGKTIIEYIIDEIIQYRIIDEIIFIVGYLGDQIKEFIERKYQKKIALSFITQEQRKGLGHAIFLARTISQGHPVLIILGDTIFKTNFKKIINSEKNFIGVKEVEDPSRFGVVFLNQEKKIEKFIEKPSSSKSKLAIVGIYLIQDSKLLFEKIDKIIKQGIKTKGEYQLTDALELLLKEKIEMEIFEIEKWLDCGKPETLLATNRVLLEQHGNNRKIKNGIIIPPVYISKNAQVEESIIGPYVSIGDNVIVKHSLISDSIINDSAMIEKLMLSGSLIGREAVLKGICRHLNIGDSSEVRFG
ncbi:MAG: 2-C-methyl-D-erythritol 4-phosphate cytidylyltransferase [Spirochaetes bacterium]|nr:2-C-methyl-D-erythritol 4-phosphate cytidylyltransferase [Spirochaetota bacterium]